AHAVLGEVDLVVELVYWYDDAVKADHGVECVIVACVSEVAAGEDLGGVLDGGLAGEHGPEDLVLVRHQNPLRRWSSSTLGVKASGSGSALASTSSSHRPPLSQVDGLGMNCRPGLFHAGRCGLRPPRIVSASDFFSAARYALEACPRPTFLG